MNCPKCNFQNPADAKYCQKCAKIFEPAKEIKKPEVQAMPQEHQQDGQTSLYDQRVKPKNKNLKIVIFILLGVLIIAGAVFAVIYFQKDNPVDVVDDENINIEDMDLDDDVEEEQDETEGDDLDSDNDGLTDDEENNIWFTDPGNPDTDGDGYEDGDEVDNGYDPLVAGSARLEDRNDISNWQTYTSEKYGFEFKCPIDWQTNQNKNYGGSVDLTDCSKIYSGVYAFDDGISVSFGFVPENIADNYGWGGKNWANQLFESVRDEKNSQPYFNNGFEGWISMETQIHTLKLIARHEAENGYYEVSADAMGDTKTDEEFKEIVNNIVSTFRFLD